MKEIEVLVKIDDDIKQAQAKLKSLNFQGSKHTLDIYFQDPKRKNLQPDKDLSLKECFRIRSKDDKYYITYKVDHFDKNGSWTYSDEHETEVSDFDSALKIISHLGLEQLVEIDNTKYTYLTEEYETVLEDVKGLGVFLEVELLYPDDSCNVEEKKNKIRKFIHFLGLEFEELNIGKPELMLRKKK